MLHKIIPDDTSDYLGIEFQCEGSNAVGIYFVEHGEERSPYLSISLDELKRVVKYLSQESEEREGS